MISFKSKTFQSKQIKVTQNISHLAQTVSVNLAMAKLLPTNALSSQKTLALIS